jgi:hypothetical protein
MSSSFRRFEILLPLQLNDGRPVPDELIVDTLLELRGKFGAVSCETQTIHGMWTQDADVYRDELIRLFVDTADTQVTKVFFIELKERLKRRFDQVEIWITTYPIEVL